MREGSFGARANNPAIRRVNYDKVHKTEFIMIDKKTCIALVLFVIFPIYSTIAHAMLVAEYDLNSAGSSPSGTAHSATTVDPQFTASDLVLVNGSNTVNAFSNHFYHDGWDTTFNLAKYYALTIDTLAPAYILDRMSFSLEELSGTNSDWELRSSVDGFAGPLSGGTFGGGVVTSFVLSLASLGTLTLPTEFRWYMTGSTTNERVGFANHECPGTGCGLNDLGQDLQIFASPVPVPAAIWLFGSALVGFIGMSRRRNVS